MVLAIMGPLEVAPRAGKNRIPAAGSDIDVTLQRGLDSCACSVNDPLHHATLEQRAKKAIAPHDITIE